MTHTCYVPHTEYIYISVNNLDHNLFTQFIGLVLVIMEELKLISVLQPWHLQFLSLKVWMVIILLWQLPTVKLAYRICQLNYMEEQGLLIHTWLIIVYCIKYSEIYNLFQSKIEDTLKRMLISLLHDKACAIDKKCNSSISSYLCKRITNYD